MGEKFNIVKKFFRENAADDPVQPKEKKKAETRAPFGRELLDDDRKLKGRFRLLKSAVELEMKTDTKTKSLFVVAIAKAKTKTDHKRLKESFDRYKEYKNNNNLAEFAFNEKGGKSEETATAIFLRLKEGAKGAKARAAKKGEQAVKKVADLGLAMSPEEVARNVIKASAVLKELAKREARDAAAEVEAGGRAKDLKYRKLRLVTAVNLAKKFNKLDPKNEAIFLSKIEKAKDVKDLTKFSKRFAEYTSMRTVGTQDKFDYDRTEQKIVAGDRHMDLYKKLLESNLPKKVVAKVERLLGSRKMDDDHLVKVAKLMDDYSYTVDDGRIKFKTKKGEQVNRLANIFPGATQKDVVLVDGKPAYFRAEKGQYYYAKSGTEYGKRAKVFNGNKVEKVKEAQVAQYFDAKEGMLTAVPKAVAADIIPK